MGAVCSQVWGLFFFLSLFFLFFFFFFFFFFYSVNRVSSSFFLDLLKQTHPDCIYLKGFLEYLLTGTAKRAVLMVATLLPCCCAVTVHMCVGRANC